MKRGLLVLCGLLLAWQALAAIDTWQFSTPAQEQQFREITAQLRCPKCQNNSVADSDAMIAADMRAKVYQLLQEGKTRQQIIDYMVARYGNFVSYDPPLTPATVALWAVPLLFVVAGCGVLLAGTRRRAGKRVALDERERQRLAQLLSKGKDQ
ncbi:cytochrome c-type biogenesis protein [Shimwellia blattae]|uniref:Cytochrome c-type biogenesis protein n=1 Tax=Shimwellia blattae (strain ATCC 29907 / DSM 4481 / JCM 1650 / NBRC 105725 / CDC 9005-74) TaxID=630626 RepID=I2BC50_SHIBC|nr:cytochrome c-type biogenesis protein [Shimwellia blattae]AFJ48104.1 cytochrome c-type biogenesis protein CcmH precursor [Shimwellia blattae DSM 4481 = NBRC 105725]GAB81909.1 cytochrome c-type biogenesis protein CcmH [Shimwellia blattae DSM 4481 = NBRC 105725]VDY65602.1 Cytochrome c-type biogenesis protein CcmH precursor [Shimwellia blattae]VEC25069.1 Cytochrome c-type biogenesis protein CcmH precursor [Shimwellia blattae]